MGVSQASFITLGTNSGPLPNARRSEPANLLRVADQIVLIDVGDGAPEQLSKIGVGVDKVATVFISHLHFDHTGGLFALLGMRYQTVSPNVLTIYGPPGTQELVSGLLAAMQPFTRLSGASMRARTQHPPAESVRVIEIVDGSKVTLGPLLVTAATNSHYSFDAGSPEAAQFLSLSYRFDLPDRAIVYTGDTGPSENVERLATGADLLVSEIIDPELAIAQLKAVRPDLNFLILKMVEKHFKAEHLTANEVGLLAQKAGVKALVLTHNAIPDESLTATGQAIAAHFGGRITFARDLDTF